MDYTVKTPNFNFVLRVEDFPDAGPKHKLYVGDKKGECLEATVFLHSANSLYEPQKCILHQIDALEECASPIVDDKDASLGKELLYAFINILKNNYPHVTEITLRDASYIPCNRRTKDTLDLLSYNVAVYGQTWYELHGGAHLLSHTKQQLYEREIVKYMNTETKLSRRFSDLVRLINKQNDYAFQHLNTNLQKYEEMYNNASTFSEFFRKLKNTVHKLDLCRFFKSWLEIFIQDFVHIERDWVIPINTNRKLETLQVMNVSKKRNMRRRTRKLRRTVQ